MDELISLTLKLPRKVDITPESAQTFFASLLEINKTSRLHKLLKKSPKPLGLEIVLKNQEISFQIAAHPDLTNFIESQLESAYPLVVIEKGMKIDAHKTFKIEKLVLKNGSYYPIKTFKDFKDVDPLSSVLTVLSKGETQDIAIIQFALEGVSTSWQVLAENFASHGTKKEDGNFIPRPDANIVKEKIKNPGFKVSVRIASNNTHLLSQIEQSFNVYTRPEGNSFTVKRPFSLTKRKLLKDFNQRKVSDNQIVNIEELATLWHLPSEKIKTQGVSWGASVLSEPPSNLPISEDISEGEKRNINFFAKTTFKNKEVVFGIKDGDRMRHIWAIGKTGTGKSTLIANMAIDDMKKGRGLAVIDPHGDLSEVLLNFVPKERINDVIYFNPSDKEFSVSINPLEVTNKNEAEFVVSATIAVFSKIFGKFWGPRLEYVLRNALLTLTEVPNSTLLDVPLILTNKDFRTKTVSNLKDQVLKNFWINEFENLPPNLQKEVIFPILNKIGQFVTSPTIRNIIGHPKSSVDLEKIINEEKILIANLSQGKIGEDNAQLLGAMLITKFQLAAMRRVNMEEEKRKDFYLYVDEFQNFATTSFIKILSEARKYHLNLMLANQYMAQIPPNVQKAILGNAGTLISFSSGAEDAHVLNKEFGEVFTEENLINLQNYQIATKLIIDGHSQRPFLATTLPLPKSKNQNKEKVIRVSQERWGRRAKK
ncbi:MAG TPA: DUF87 domain-containing protein [Patescibacteria group bacterium]